jgi:hypothetical protein
MMQASVISLQHVAIALAGDEQNDAFTIVDLHEYTMV